jgi:hypothetical protein
MQMSAPLDELLHSTVYLQSGIATNFVLTASPNLDRIDLQFFNPNEPRQQWEMTWYDHWGIAYINKGTGKALGTGAGEPLHQIDPAILNATSLWTLGSDEGLNYHAIRTLLNDDINLNVAGNGPYFPGSDVIAYDGWGGGKPNEVWRFFQLTNTIEMMLRSPIEGTLLPLVLASGNTNQFSDLKPVVVEFRDIQNRHQRWIRKQRFLGWELRNAADGWYLFGSGHDQHMFLVPPYENTEDYRGRIFDIFAQTPTVGTNAFFNIFGTDASDVDRFAREWEKHTRWTETPQTYGGGDLFNIHLADYAGYPAPFILGYFFEDYDTPSINIFGNGPYNPGNPVGLWTGGRDSNQNELWALDLFINGRLVGLNANTAPSISCPPNLVVTNNPGICGAAVTFAPSIDDPTLVSGTNYTFAPGSIFPVGTTTNTISVIDRFSNVFQCSFTITVLDLEPPQIQAPASVVVGNDPGKCVAIVNFNVTTTDNCAATVTCTPPSGSFFPKGTTIVTCRAVDTSGNSATNTFPVTVNDIEPPDIKSITPTPGTLWPPNHKMIPVTLTVVVTDNCAVASTRIVNIESNEPINGLGDGNTSPDWTQAGNLTLQLRAERSGTGKTGRAYTITVESIDTSGNKSRKTAPVLVPKS